MKDKDNKLILCKDDEGLVSVNVRFAKEDVWLTQEQLAQIYGTTQQNVSQHIQGILGDGELEDEATVKYFLTVQKEGSREVSRNIDSQKRNYFHYKLLRSLGEMRNFAA